MHLHFVCLRPRFHCSLPAAVQLFDEEEDEQSKNDAYIPPQVPRSRMSVVCEPVAHSLVQFRLLKILNKEEHQRVKIVMYPMPSKLYTVTLENKMSAMKVGLSCVEVIWLNAAASCQERELESWLETLASKYER